MSDNYLYDLFINEVKHVGGFGGSSGGGTGGAPFKYKRYTIEYAPSDLTPSDDNDITFLTTDAKQEEMINLFAELTALTTINMNISITVPGMGEIMRLPVMFDTKNEATGGNGIISSLTHQSYSGHDVVCGAISIFTGGFSIVPIEYTQPIAMLGLVCHIDVLYL